MVLPAILGALWLLGACPALCGTPPFAGEAAEEPRTGLMHMPAEGQPRRECWLYLPKAYDRAKTWPLVVVLHPAGLHGSRFVSIWGEAAERTGAFIVAGPECRDQKKRVWDIGDEKALLATVRKVMALFNADPARVLLTGFSQGGNYTYTFGLRNPDLFRAIAPASGALVARPGPEGEAILQKARGLGVYVVHGAADDRVPVERARASRIRLEQAGYVVAYREVPQLGHFFPQGEADRIWGWFAALTSPPQPARKP